jgi:hypothetical protein
MQVQEWWNTHNGRLFTKRYFLLVRSGVGAEGQQSSQRETNWKLSRSIRANGTVGCPLLKETSDRCEFLITARASARTLL